jgi:hypothetical protein
VRTAHHAQAQHILFGVDGTGIISQINHDKLTLDNPCFWRIMTIVENTCYLLKKQYPNEFQT